MSGYSSSGRVLTRATPRDADGKPLSDGADLKATERFLDLITEVARSAASIERCIAAIETPRAKTDGFVFLPLGPPILGSRFLPASVVQGGLHAVDLIGRPTLSPEDTDELMSALTRIRGFVVGNFYDCRKGRNGYVIRTAENRRPMSGAAYSISSLFIALPVVRSSF